MLVCHNQIDAEVSKGCLMVSEILAAGRVIVKAVQRKSFVEDIDLLEMTGKNMRLFPWKSPLWKLIHFFARAY